VSSWCSAITLLEGTGGTIGLWVESDGDSAVALAGSETIRVITRHVPCAPSHVIDVLAVCSGVGTTRLANADAILLNTHEVGPFVDLLAETMSTIIPDIGEDEATMRISHTISTVRVKLASSIASSDIDLLKVSCASDLDVVRGLNPMHGIEGAIGEQALAAARMTAISDNHLF